MHREHDLINIHFFVILKTLMTVAANPIVFVDMTTGVDIPRHLGKVVSE
jgi:hypothetical protein